MDKISLNNLPRQHEVIARELEEAIQRVVRSCAFINGPDVAAFEGEFATYCQTKHAVGISNGTEAISVGLKAMGLKAGDQVMTVANTFVATLSATAAIGAVPVLVDVDPKTMLMEPNRVREYLRIGNNKDKIKALIPVHLYGQLCDMEAFAQIAKEFNLVLLEDAAQAHGAERKGKRAGHYGNLATFSFFPGKNLGAFGDAGALVTNDPKIAEFSRKYRNHGRVDKYLSEIQGTNARLDTLQAAILRVKLKKLEEWTNARAKFAQTFASKLSGLRLGLPVVDKDCRHVFHLFVVRVADRQKVMDHLKKKGIECGVHYPTPAHMQPGFAHLGYSRGDFPVTEKAAEEILSLPLDPFTTQEEMDYMVKTLAEVVPGNAK